VASKNAVGRYVQYELNHDFSTIRMMNRRVSAGEASNTGDNFPDVARGEVVRTSGKLVDSPFTFHEDSRLIPVAGRSQVLVCGGGPVGIAAALASARSGAETQLLELAGCISGDFFAHSSYRVTGNAVPMGEATGKAAAESINKGVLPHELTWSAHGPGDG
jgi:hypothetical protein